MSYDGIDRDVGKRGPFTCRIASLFLLQRLKGSMLGDERDFNNMETRVVIKFLFPARQGTEGNSSHSVKHYGNMQIWTCGSPPRSGSRNAWTRIKNVNGASRLVAIACFLPGLAKDLSAPLVLISFPLQQWFLEHASMLRYHTLPVLFVSCLHDRVLSKPYGKLRAWEFCQEPWLKCLERLHQWLLSVSNVIDLSLRLNARNVIS